MSKNLGIIDPKPRNRSVTDIKPNNKAVQNVNPRNTTIAVDFGTEQYYTVVFKAGQSMGLLLALTYKTAGTVSSPVSRY